MKARRWDKECLRAGCRPEECDCRMGATQAEKDAQQQADADKRDGIVRKTRRELLPAMIDQAEKDGRRDAALAMSLEYDAGPAAPSSS